MKEEFRKMLSELVGEELEFDGFKEEFEKEGLPHDLVFRAIQAAQLKRIADSLEHIDGLLSGCVGYVPPRQGYVQAEGYNFLRIGGGVDTGY